MLRDLYFKSNGSQVVTRVGVVEDDELSLEGAWNMFIDKRPTNIGKHFFGPLYTLNTDDENTKVIDCLVNSS